MEALNCPKGHGPMALKVLRKKKSFRGIDIKYSAEAFVCPVCRLEAGSVKTAGDVQHAIVDAYRKR